MLEFIAAVYNEEKQLESLISSVYMYVDTIRIVDDGSTDSTPEILDLIFLHSDLDFNYDIIEHTGLPETVKHKALDMCQDDSWILMLDADERILPLYMEKIKEFVSGDTGDITHVWFNLIEYIDGVQTRFFQKCRLFKKNAIRFSDTIHEDDRFEGQGVNFSWIIFHNKTEAKQRMREQEYLATYERLLAEGKITKEWRDRIVGFHYFEKELRVPHG